MSKLNYKKTARNNVGKTITTVESKKWANFYSPMKKGSKGKIIATDGENWKIKMNNGKSFFLAIPYDRNMVKVNKTKRRK